MYKCYSICYFITKRTIDTHTCRLLSRREFSIKNRRHDQFPKLSISNAGVHKPSDQVTCRGLQSQIALRQGLLGLHSGRENVESCKNFSTSSTIWSSTKGSHQNKEKLKNYIFLGITLGSVLYVFYMVQFGIDYHQDYIYVEPTEKKK